MKINCLFTVLLLIVFSAAVLAADKTSTPSNISNAALPAAKTSSNATAAGPLNTISGDYVEARTASVFAGACHYNGELVTTGNDAVLAWNVAAGQWNGVNLAGVKAIAVVSAQANLVDDRAPRKSELVIDAATAVQANAFAAAMQEHCAAALGEIISIRRAPIQFSHIAGGYTVNADHFASCAVQPMPNGECCTQPNLVWYKPLVTLSNRKVGFTKSSGYLAGTLGDPWQRANENSAFYGSFAF